MKLQCLVFLGFLVATQAATVRHRQREIPVQVVYEDARSVSGPAKTVIPRDTAKVEAQAAAQENIAPEIQKDTADVQDNAVVGEKAVKEDPNAIKYFSRIKNLDAKVQLSPEDLAQSLKHLPFAEPSPEASLRNAPLEAASEQQPEPALAEAKPSAEAQQQTSEAAKSSTPAASEEAITTQLPQSEEDEETESEESEEEEEEKEKGEEGSSGSSSSNIDAIIQRAQEIVSIGIKELKNRFNEASKNDGAWSYLEKNIEQLFITEKQKVNSMGQARQGPILDSPPEQQAIKNEIGKDQEAAAPVQAEKPASDQVEGSAPNQEVQQASAPAQAQATEEAPKQEQATTQNPNQNQNQNVIQNIINGFQNITNNFIQNLQQRPAGNGTQNEEQGGGIGGAFISYFTGGFQQIVNNINNLAGGGGVQPAGNGTQADAGSTTQRPNIVSNFVNQFQQFIRPPGSPAAPAAPAGGNQSDQAPGGANQQGPGAFFQGAINQFGQAVNNIFQGNRPPGDTGVTPLPAPGPIQAFQNFSSQIISNFNQFNPFAPSTQAPPAAPAAAAGDAPSTTQRPTFVQNVGQVIQGLNPFRPPQQAGPNPVVQGIQNATDQLQQVVGNQTIPNPLEGVQNALGGAKGDEGNASQAAQAADTPPGSHQNEQNTNTNASANQNSDQKVNQDEKSSGETSRASGLVEIDEKSSDVVEDSSAQNSEMSVVVGDDAKAMQPAETLRASGLVEDEKKVIVQTDVNQNSSAESGVANDTPAMDESVSQSQQCQENHDKKEGSEVKKDDNEPPAEMMQAVE